MDYGVIDLAPRVRCGVVRGNATHGLVAIGARGWCGIARFGAHWFGKLCLLGWTWALFYHLCNGIRHLGWDVGMGFELDTARNTGYLVFAASVVLTGLAWLVGLAMGGA